MYIADYIDSGGILMRISIIGTGYVGTVTGACLAEMGHEVFFIGRNKKKLNDIEKGKSPIFEPQLDRLLKKNIQRIATSTQISDGLQNNDLTFVCVGTPPREDGSIDLEQIENVALSIGRSLASAIRRHTVIIKSTVLPGTIEDMIIPILERESGKKAYVDFGIGSNPEFLKEGSAVDDFFHTDRIVFGSNDESTRELLENLYRPLNVPLFSTNIRTSEMVKYASNAFLATKISFANEIGNLCKELGIDSYEVFAGVGLDNRINPYFFRSGIGFGGSCFPKDVQALIAQAASKGVTPRILLSVMSTNQDQPTRMIALLKKHLNPEGQTIGILGLAFKPDTDDIRESRAIPIIKTLLEEGASIIAYDPVAMPNFKEIFPRLHYATTALEVLKSDATLIVTEWKEFESLDFHGKIIIDGRRIEKARKEAKIYEGVCW
jgi:UDPglucose 6-dehydrogenase